MLTRPERKQKTTKREIQAIIAVDMLIKFSEKGPQPPTVQ
jgi:hypothetical protein